MVVRKAARLGCNFPDWGAAKPGGSTAQPRIVETV
jgi:hypothetical protein